MNDRTLISTKRGSKIVGKAILAVLLGSTIIAVGAVAPNLFVAVDRLLKLKNIRWTEDEPHGKKKIKDSFRYLRNQGLVNMEYRGRQLHISLTTEGKKKAKKLDIDALAIQPQKRWDGIWRMILFDIEETRKVTREALRGKLKELGFYLVQKSVWIHAFPCDKEVGILRDFFGLDEVSCVWCEVRKLPEHIEQSVKEYFNIR